jgi:AcrR family transcriptional regulator
VEQARRPYRLQERARRQADTRQRIVQAAVDLHETLGPAETSILAIANRAGVQRHTLYAHFPDLDSLFRACSGHWWATHPFPDVEGLQLHEALDAIYRWFEQNETALDLFARDRRLYPQITAEREQEQRRVAGRLAASIGKRKPVRAAVGHAIAFETWRSLVRREGLTRRQAVDAMVGFVGSV